MVASKKKLRPLFWVIIIILVSAALRLIAIDKPLFTDEVGWGIITGHRFMGVFTILPLVDVSWFFPHPPLGPLAYIISTSIFGLHAWSLRLVPFVFGIGTLAVTYLLANKLYGKKAALISVLIMGISFWHILASLQVDIDGSVLSFFFTSFFYCLVMYEERKDNFWKILSGMTLGLSFLTKYASIILPIVALIYLVVKKKNLRTIVGSLFPVFAIGAAIFLVFPLFSLFSEKRLFLDTLMWGAKNVVRQFSIRPFIYVLFYATPLLFGNAILSLLKPKKEDALFWIWILLVFVIYVTVLGAPKGPFERYLMVIIPALSILCAKFLADIRLSYRELILACIIFAASYLLLLSLNSSGVRYLAHDPNEYIKEALSLRWDFNFPFTGSSGPQFWLSFSSMAIPLIISVLFLVMYIIAEKIGKVNLSKAFFVVFIAVALSFNVLLVQEYLFSLTHPSPDKATLELVSYNSHSPLKEPVYSNLYQQGFYFYTNISNYNHLLPYEDENIDKIKPVLEQNGGSVVLIDYPGFSRESESWRLLGNCTELKTISDKNKTLVYIYHCEKTKSDEKTLDTHE